MVVLWREAIKICKKGGDLDVQDSIKKVFGK